MTKDGENNTKKENKLLIQKPFNGICPRIALYLELHSQINKNSCLLTCDICVFH